MLPNSTHGPMGAPSIVAEQLPLDGPAAAETTEKAIAALQHARIELEGFQQAYPKLVPAVRALQRIERRLQRPLRIAIAGEFNSGKSSLANLLVGIESLPTAIVSNTRIPTLIYYAAAPEIFAVGSDSTRTPLAADNHFDAASMLRLEVGLPSPSLQSKQLVDLPGVADPRFDDGAADPSAHGIDAILWCTAATQAWKETERQTWSALPARLQARGILVVTHRDLLAGADDEQKLLARLTGAVEAEFHDVILLSAASGAEPPMIVLPPDRHETSRQAKSFEALEQAIDRLLRSIRQERVSRALEVTRRIGARTFSWIGS